MSAPQDERFALPVEQSALLWCMRVWVLGLTRSIGADDRIREMLGRFDAPGAAAFFEGFMFCVRHGARRRIGVECVCRQRVSPDEYMLLDAVALAQDGRAFEAARILSGMLTARGASAAAESAAGIGRELARAGRFLPTPECEGPRAAAADAAGWAGRPADATLH